MKKLLSLTIATLLGLVAVAENDTLYVMNEGALVSKRAINDIDSLTFNAPKDAVIAQESAPKAKYIFYFIGDGMAAPQINMAELAAKNDGVISADFSGADIIGALNMTSFPVVGMQRTHSDTRYITGSAASATSLASGIKTSINTIGRNSDYSKDYITIAEVAKAEGMKVGIISSVSIDHATPAAFYAHSDTRNNYNFIASQMDDSNFDYFGGGWAKGYRTKYHATSINNHGAETTVTPVTDEATEMDEYKIVTTRADFDNLTTGAGKVWAYTKMGDGSGSLPYINDIDEDNNGADISLSEFTAKGIELLKDGEKGFFIMVEAGKIDWACHANDIASSIANTLEFDKAIGEALAFYNENPDSTLIIVTGDHETGGLTLGYGATYETAYEAFQHQTMSYEVFDDKMAEWTSADFSAAMSATNEAFGLGDSTTAKHPALILNGNEQIALAEAFFKSCNKRMPYEAKSTEDKLKYGGYNAFTMEICHLLSYKCGIGWTSYKHTAVPVPVFAIGAGAENFNGYYENTKVPVSIHKAAQFESAFPAEK